VSETDFSAPGLDAREIRSHVINVVMVKTRTAAVARLHGNFFSYRVTISRVSAQQEYLGFT